MQNSYFLGSQIPIFLFFWPFLLLDALEMSKTILRTGVVLFHQHFWGGPLPPPLPGGPLPPPLPEGGSSSVTTLGGLLLPPLPGGRSSSTSTLGASSSASTSRGVLFHPTSGVPCDLSHNALIYHYRMPQCIMGKIHMGLPPPPPQTDWQTRLKTFIFPHYVAGGN